MISSVKNNITALSALDKKLSVTANNIANVETDGFKKSRALLKASPNGDITVEISQVETPGPIIDKIDREGNIVETELSNVDLSEELPKTALTRTNYNANLKMLQTHDEMLGSIIDIIE